MALPAQDNFNRSTGIGANWTGSFGVDLAIESNIRVYGGGVGADSSMYWSADAPNANQYAQVKLLTAADWSGPFVHGSATDWVMFDAAWGDATKNYKIEWYNSGSYTVIGSAYNTTPAANDVIRIETTGGTTFTGYLNGTQRCTGSNASAPATGYGGIYCYGQNHYLDDFEVGNVVVATIDQLATRARNDDGSESAATTIADGNFTAPLDTNVRIRVQVDATGDVASTTYQLEAQKNGDLVWAKVTT